jgi:hypothetical protein
MRKRVGPHFFMRRVADQLVVVVENRLRVCRLSIARHHSTAMQAGRFQAPSGHFFLE